MSTFDIDRFISDNPKILEALYNDENSQIDKREFDDIPRNENYIKFQEEKKKLENEIPKEQTEEINFYKNAVKNSLEKAEKKIELEKKE
jgi:Ca2+-binding EF-hand superfamily protein